MEIRLTATECHLPYGITVLPVTWHKWTHLALIPAMQAGTRFTYPERMEGWVDLVDLGAPRPGVEPATFRSWVRRQTTALPGQL